MATAARLRAGSQPVVDPGPPRRPPVGIGSNHPAAVIMSLQRSVGNAAVARGLARRQPATAGASHAGVVEMQRCGPIPCDGSDGERAEYTAGGSVQRRVHVAREDAAPGDDPVDPPKAMHTAETATPENLQLAQVIDELDKLSDDKLYERRDAAVVGATKDGGEGQEGHIRTLQAIEFLASRRGLDALKPNWDRVSRTRPVARRLNVRVLLEQAVREKGSFKKAVEAYPDKGDAEADFRFFEAEAERFKRQFRGQARLTADRMLEESLQAIARVLSSYGIPPGSARSAARELAAGTGEADELAQAVVASAKRSSDVDEPAKEKNRESLAITVENLKKHQAEIRQLKKEDEELFERWREDRAKFDKALTEHARTIDKNLETSRNTLKGAWIKAERAHPVLASYQSEADLEDIDLGKLDTDPVDRQMKAVVAQLLPKMVDIGKARGMLKNDLDFAVKLPSVIALTRTNMFVPEGSLRAGMVNDLAAEAKGDDSLVRAAALAIALLTLIPTGGMSLAVPLGMASAGLAVYSVTKEWEKYKTVKTLSNTGLDLARSLSTEEPSLTGFAVSLVELGLEGLPLIGAFKKARQLKRLANAGEDTAEVVKDLNRIGRAHDAPDLGERALIEARKDARKAVAGAERGVEQTAERGAAKAESASLKETAAGVAVCVQALTVQRVRAEPVLPIQRIVLQRAAGAKAGDVCALLPKDVRKAAKDAIRRLVDGGGKLPPSLLRDPELLAKIVHDSEATKGLCRLMRRVDALDPGTQKALIDALAKHGDDLLPMLRDVENGVNRLTSAEFKELMAALNELPTGVEGLSRWMTKLHQPDHKMFKGTFGEIEYAGKLQGELAGSGRRIAKVADTIGGKEAGDILVVTRRGQLDEIINVKNYNWVNPWYQSKGNQKLLADYFSERATSLARRYAKEYGVPLGKAKDMVTIVLRGSPPQKLLDMLKKVRWRLG